MHRVFRVRRCVALRVTHPTGYAEHAAEVPKIRSFVKWIEGQVRLERGGTEG